MALYLVSQGYLRYYKGPHKGDYEHRIKTSAMSNQVVHHINGRPWDNRLSNLRVMKKGEHDRLTARRKLELRVGLGEMTKEELEALRRRGVRVGPLLLALVEGEE